MTDSRSNHSVSEPGAVVDRHRGIYDPRDPDAVSLVNLVNAVLKRRRLVVAITAGLFFVVIIFTLLGGRKYSANVSFVPQASTSMAGQVGGLAAQLGFTLPVAAAGESPDFYADLVRSRELLERVITSSYSVTYSRGIPLLASKIEHDGNLLAIFGLEHQPPEIGLEKAIIKLNRLVRTRVHRETGIVSVTVTTRWPDVSGAIAERILTLVGEFDLSKRQSRAAAERRFVEARVHEIELDLREAEDAEQRFLEQNREFSDSPQLQFEYGRLQDDVSRRRQVYTTLTQAYETARIEEVRNTPVLTVIDPAQRPALPDRRGLLIKGATAIIFGLALGILIAVTLDFMQRGRESEAERYAEFEALRRETLSDFRRVLSGFSRRALPKHHGSDS